MTRTASAATAAIAAVMSVSLTAAAATPLSAQSIAARAVGAAEHSVAGPAGAATSARELSDGRLVITTAGPSGPMLVNFEGRTAERIGKSGSGELDWAAPTVALPLPGDSTAVFDARLRKLLVLAPDGHVVKATPLFPERGPLAIRGVAMPRTTDVLGRVYAEVIPRGDTPRPSAQAAGGRGGRGGRGGAAPPARAGGAPPPGPLLTDSVLIVRFDRGSNTLDTLAWARRPFAAVPTPNRVSNTEVLVALPGGQFGWRDDWGVRADGSIGLLRGDTYAFDWIADGGARTSAAPISHDAPQQDRDARKQFVDSTKKAIKTVVDQQTKAMKQAVAQRDVRAVPPDPFVKFEEPKWPETMPVFTRPMLTDRNGDFWITVTCSGTPNGCWDFVGADGARRARYQAPPNSRLVGVGMMHLYVTEPGTDGQRVLSRYPIP